MGGDARRRSRRVRAVVLAGAGKMFCAGADVAWMAGTVTYTEEENLRTPGDVARCSRAIDTLPVPLIGRVQARRSAAAPASPPSATSSSPKSEAMFGFTEVKLGIMPAVISPFVLAKIGRSAARELFLTGARFSARAREGDRPGPRGRAGRRARRRRSRATSQEILSARPGGDRRGQGADPEVWGAAAETRSRSPPQAIADARVARPEGAGRRSSKSDVPAGSEEPRQLPMPAP